MTRRQARKLHNGVYRVWWKEGGSSVAAIGRDPYGDVWIAPANWVVVNSYGFYWRKVARVELLAAS